MQETLSIKVSSSEKARLRAVAKARRSSISGVLKSALRHVLETSNPQETGTCYELARDLFEQHDAIGASGVGDLSYNKKHLVGFGRKRR